MVKAEEEAGVGWERDGDGGEGRGDTDGQEVIARPEEAPAEPRGEISSPRATPPPLSCLFLPRKFLTQPFQRLS